MVFGSAGNKIKAFRQKRFSECLTIHNHLLLIIAEIVGQGFLKTDSLCRNHMHERTTLNPRENTAIYFLLIRFFRENKSAARATKCLVGRARHKIRMRDRRWV